MVNVTLHKHTYLNNGLTVHVLKRHLRHQGRQHSSAQNNVDFIFYSNAFTYKLTAFKIIVKTSLNLIRINRSVKVTRLKERNFKIERKWNSCTITSLIVFQYHYVIIFLFIWMLVLIYVVCYNVDNISTNIVQFAQLETIVTFTKKKKRFNTKDRSLILEFIWKNVNQMFNVYNKNKKENYR